MASSSAKIMFVFLVLSLALPNTSANNIFEINWVVGGNFAALLSLETIRVGDSLHFSFSIPHTVAEVDEFAYVNCNAPIAAKIYTSGSVSYTCSTIGTRFFISTAPGDCEAGLKLKAVVL